MPTIIHSAIRRHRHDMMRYELFIIRPTVIISIIIFVVQPKTVEPAL